MTSSNGNIFRVGPLCGEFTDHRWIPLTKASDAELFFYLRLNKRLVEQSRRRWFETPSRSSLRHCKGRRPPYHQWRQSWYYGNSWLSVITLSEITYNFVIKKCQMNPILAHFKQHVWNTFTHIRTHLKDSLHSKVSKLPKCCKMCENGSS